MLLLLLWRIGQMNLDCSLRPRVEWRFEFDAAEVRKRMCWMPVRG